MDEKHSKQRGFSLILNSLGPAFKELGRNDPLRMAGATAFFTMFALPPILFILIQFFGFFIDWKNMDSELIRGISNTLGDDGAKQVRRVLQSIRGFSEKWYVLAGGFIFLLFVATTLFAVIKGSFNQIWLVEIKERPGFFFGINLRMRSLAVIALAGLLFLADMLSGSLELIGSNRIEVFWPEGAKYIKGIYSEGMSIAVVSLWFIILFRFLADGRPTWRAALTGGILTGILFTLGKELLSYLLVKSDIGALYGASGSIVLVLLFVFYSSFILYYGACFIHIYSQKRATPVKPTHKAYTYKIQEVGEKSVKTSP